MQGNWEGVGVDLAAKRHGGSRAGTAAGSCYQPWARRTTRRGNVRRAGRQELTPPAAGLREGGCSGVGREQTPTDGQKPS